MKIFLLVFLLAGDMLFAMDTAASRLPAISLSELAAKSDLVALVQARDTDYLRRREIPVSGSAYLKILIAYKGGIAGNLVEVYEKGLHENECYFPEVSVFEEGRRFLVFLVHDPEQPERYRGLPEGCALDVLVNSNNRYALRVPVNGINLSDSLDAQAEDMSFSDRYAIVDDEDLAPELRKTLLDTGHIRPYRADAGAESDYLLPGQTAAARLWQFTSGIPLEAVRKQIDPQALVD